MLKKLLKQDTSDLDVPDPDDDESENDFMDRCVDQLMSDNDDLEEDDALDACQMAWDDRSAEAARCRETSGTTFKTHAAEVHGMEFVLSDESVDRMGDIISASGWDLANFNKNPIALFGHQTSFPIGKWADLRVDGAALKGKLIMAPEGTSARIDEIRRLIDADILRAVSVGFRVLERKARKNDQGDYVGEHFLRQELLETSLVSVPANANALAVAKSLRISADTLDLVFAEPGDEQTRSRTSRLHRRARQTSSNGKPTIMSLSQRIVDQQAHVVALRDKLAEHLKNVDDTNVSDAQLAITTELNEQIKRGDASLAALQDAEKQLAMRAGGEGEGGERGERQVSTQVLVQRREGDGETNIRHLFGLPMPKKVQPHEHVIRGAICLAFAHRYRKTVQEARSMIYPKDEATKAYIDYVEKTASAPAMTTVTGWAQELAQTIYADFMALLMPKSVYPRLASYGLGLSFGRAGRIVIPTRNRTPTIAGSFVGEGQPIPVRQGQFTSQTLTPKKMAVITVWTREIDEHSIPALEGLLRQAVQEDTAVSLDSVLLDTNPATVVRPAGLFNGITPITPTAGGGFNALVGDMKAITANVLALTQGHIRTPVWLMNPTQVNSIKLTPNALGEFPFRAEISAGNLLDYPLIDSGTVPLGTVGMVDAADFVSAGAEAPRFEISDQATLHMEDTTPLPIVDGGVPAAPVRSLWQTDSLGLRLILPMNWMMRRPITALINGVTW
ncbi:phage prohead protease, HK97 family/phage major capsid protein, HK97 family,TIGR01554 [Bradyrhizobium erythrophlei]|nr:phage prohead protease, HK97 family/phage major capsid protein, HK97 family,TIGR01554 [Bradyrhizobium erythrophlei]